MPRARSLNRPDVFGDVKAPCAALAETDRVFAHALDAIGAPHIRRRPGGFEALFRIIVEQQVSVPSAQAIWARCLSAIDPLTPHSALEAGDAGLRACGLSGPKARYVLALAAAMTNGAFDPAKLSTMHDEAAIAALQSLKGVGPWSAAIYLLFCEGRIDIWPPRDVALLGAYCEARRAAGFTRPAVKMDRMDARAARWAPWRGVAAHILWTYYAHQRGRTPI
ncbi:MAG: DNA-3-methyladenine glycosylase 2 family protein [Pseudomonadota bacterium]